MHKHLKYLNLFEIILDNLKLKWYGGFIDIIQNAKHTEES